VSVGYRDFRSSRDSKHEESPSSSSSSSSSSLLLLLFFSPLLSRPVRPNTRRPHLFVLPAFVCLSISSPLELTFSVFLFSPLLNDAFLATDRLVLAQSSPFVLLLTNFAALDSYSRSLSLHQIVFASRSLCSSSRFVRRHFVLSLVVAEWSIVLFVLYPIVSTRSSLLQSK
jgi:hypothetical protein